ncbi:MAG TPA: hypothetical protein VMT85_08125 [Thermoanaerobaculia bacterium]|nr:hypothetical protein [Thermoanaerobaculia bacterium]
MVELELGACLLLGGERERGRTLVNSALPRIERRRGGQDPRLARGRALLAALAPADG